MSLTQIYVQYSQHDLFLVAIITIWILFYVLYVNVYKLWQVYLNLLPISVYTYTHNNLFSAQKIDKYFIFMLYPHFSISLKVDRFILGSIMPILLWMAIWIGWHLSTSHTPLWRHLRQRLKYGNISIKSLIYYFCCGGFVV